jgi:hypothetical protein
MKFPRPLRERARVRGNKKWSAAISSMGKRQFIL